jgi:SpoVK/Ycf46/Vps4 family AAA+-type ATPase
MDEIFFVDLPGAEVRAEIFRIHLKKRKLDPAQFDLAQLARAADGFAGAEIEQAVVSAVYEAMAAQEPIATKHILTELARTKPLSVVMAEKIDALREWAAERTVQAD